MELEDVLRNLDVSLQDYDGSDITVTTPIDGSVMAMLAADGSSVVEDKLSRSQAAFEVWNKVPAPRRGEVIRLFGQRLREVKDELGLLVTMECGKILEEGKGEVQEMIDICDFAVGLSRQIGGLTLPSERFEHVMHENWYPLGVVGVISAFNFPVAVWAWNFALAIVCGNAVLWKPSEKTPLTAIACQALFLQAVKDTDDVPDGLSELVIGDSKVGKILVDDPRVALVSATGSTAMGAKVGPEVAKRFGRSLLELGGNNAVIVTESADMAITLPSVVFGAVGTAGQRCTTTRRLFVHESRYDDFEKALQKAYQGVYDQVGDPTKKHTLVGPLIDEEAYLHMVKALENVVKTGAKVMGGERVLQDYYPNGYYVNPAIVCLEEQNSQVMQETFAPIVYVMPYKTLEEVMLWHNAVPQGLSSAIFTNDIKEAEYFKQRSDCGIANVNIGTSGAEIGGAFGGEKETGGGRESGSDAWKAYMRRQTSTTFYGATPPALAQGIVFEV